MAAAAVNGHAAPSELIFLGTGSSTGVPRGSCILRNDVSCHVCQLATQGAPETNRNWRSNPSLLIRHYHPGGSVTNVQIDCGKTFRETMLRYYPKYGVHQLHALLLSHEHADACFGLDDLRSLQRFDEVSGLPLSDAIPIYLSQHSFDSINARFPYLTLSSLRSSTVRRVAQLDFLVRKDWEPVDINGFEIVPFSVQHGSDYLSWGFMFGPIGEKIVYISDVSEIPAAVDAMLKSLAVAGRSRHQCASCREPQCDDGETSWPDNMHTDTISDSGSSDSGIHLLIIDALFVSKSHPTHFNLTQALDCIRHYRPHHALLTGCSDEFEFHAINKQLAEMLVSEGLHVRMAYDGQRLAVRL